VTQIDCQQAKAHLYDYLKRELTPALIAEVRQHIEQCRDCFSCARFEESFLLMLEERRSKESCPKELRAKIIAALRSEEIGD
jgi:anti-sigma factor (TIGR02949 family)